jgi:hypothetical protein
VTNNHSELITINPITGVITTIGHAGFPAEDSVDAIAFVCRSQAPAAHHVTLLMMAAGLLVIGMLLRQRLSASA